ncbi:MAG TPA: hypothetical protein VNZ26_18495 [Vicinamibacterales bacterium]|nr:hypothetical protein [Vicinamibacterales bacterium]
MPPRFAYWTILIDQKPTAFRARLREELLPTLAQLRRTNSDVVMKWWARNKLWESPEAERAHNQRPRAVVKPTANFKTRGSFRKGAAHKNAHTTSNSAKGRFGQRGVKGRDRGRKR